MSPFKVPSSNRGSPTAPSANTAGPPTAASANRGTPTLAQTKLAGQAGQPFDGRVFLPLTLTEEERLSLLDNSFVYPLRVDEKWGGQLQVDLARPLQSEQSVRFIQVREYKLTQEETKPTYDFTYTHTMEIEGDISAVYQGNYRVLVQEEVPSLVAQAVDDRTLTEEMAARFTQAQILHQLREEGIIEIMPLYMGIFAGTPGGGTTAADFNLVKFNAITTENGPASYSTATGNFTAPFSGKYAVYANASIGTNSTRVFLSGFTSVGESVRGQDAVGFGAHLSGLVPLSSGNTLNIQLFTGTTGVFASSTGACYFHIVYVGP